VLIQGVEDAPCQGQYRPLAFRRPRCGTNNGSNDEQAWLNGLGSRSGSARLTGNVPHAPPCCRFHLEDALLDVGILIRFITPGAVPGLSHCLDRRPLTLPLAEKLKELLLFSPPGDVRLGAGNLFVRNGIIDVLGTVALTLGEGFL